MRWLDLPAALLAAGLAAAGAEAASARLGAFLDTYRCVVVEHLTAIYARRGEENRYLILSLGGQRYVQCLFFDADRQIMCEASSGFYAQPDGEPRRFRVAERGIAALGRLGFSTDDSEGNYQRQFEIVGRDDFPGIADLLLSALYLAYGARPGMQIEVEAPLAREGGSGILYSPCMPVG